MISHFWNICNKACPALEVDKVHYHGKKDKTASCVYDEENESIAG